MEGVGARLGRSSTRYGPAVVFSGPVRKWKKRWVHVYPSSNNNNACSNGNNGSHLLLYKWTPLSQSQSQSNDNHPSHNNSNDPALLPDDPPRRKFRYIPVYLLEKQKNWTGEKAEDDVKLSDAETTGEPLPKGDGFDEKPDINDIPMEEQSQNDIKVLRQDLKESTLDLSLGLKSRDVDPDFKPTDGQLERLNSR